LLLTKLQVVEITKKDILDVVALLVDLPISDKPSEIEKERILHFTSADWGIYKTLMVNVEKIRTILPELALPEKETRVVLERINELSKAIEESPKTFGWKMRAKVGDKVRWYELPEPT